MADGEGILKYLKGSATYKGGWQKGCRHGYGSNKIGYNGYNGGYDNEEYEGMWYENKKHGHGFLKKNMFTYDG